jgi:hypothetical protein
LGVTRLVFAVRNTIPIVWRLRLITYPPQHQWCSRSTVGPCPYAVQARPVDSILDFVGLMTHFPPPLARHTPTVRDRESSRDTANGLSGGDLLERGEIPTRSGCCTQESERETSGLRQARLGFPGICFYPEVLVVGLNFPCRMLLLCSFWSQTLSAPKH